MKILINTPSLKGLGGVSNHYIGLQPHWKELVRYNTVGKRNSNEGSGIYWIIWDIIKFLWCLLTFHPNVVLLNPSLGKNAILRDFIFLRISTFFRFKTAVLIHGFDWNYANNTNHEWLAKNFNRSDLIFVLADEFRQELKSWGITTRIELQTAKVDDRLLENFDINKKSGRVKNIVYIARIEKEKGVYIAVDAFAQLKKLFPELIMTIVGGGSELEKLIKYISDESIQDINVTGRVSFERIIDEFSKGDLYLFPTYYGEGMPSSVLEGMAFGMPVFTRNVGGIPDFFENDKMGFMTESMDAAVFAKAMIPYIESQELTKKVSLYNHEYAKRHFLASKVALSIEQALKTIVSC